MMKRLLCMMLAFALLCGCAAVPAGTTAPETTVPMTTAGPMLKPGFYICNEELAQDSLLHFRFFEDGTGYLSMLGAEAELTWTGDGDLCVMGEQMPAIPTAGGMLAFDEEFEYVGDALPGDYFPDPPEPGVYAVSSVGRDGDMDFYGSLSRSNGYLELREDGTGVLDFDDCEYPFSMDGATAVFDGWKLVLFYMSGEEAAGEPLVMVYVMDGPIQADSIAFRLMEGEA